MTPSVASIVYTIGILALFMLERTRSGRAKWYLWIPIIWFLISGSRHVSIWLNPDVVLSPDQYLEGSPLDSAIYAVLILAAMLVLVTRWEPVIRLARKNWPIVLFVLYCAISVLWSDFPFVAFKRWIKSLGDYAMIVMLLTEADWQLAVNQVLTRVSYVVLPLSVLTIKYYPSIGRSYAAHWDATQFFTGICDTKNMLGMVCLIFGFAAVWRLLHNWRNPKRTRWIAHLLDLIVVLMAVWLLIQSDSKTSLSSFVLASGAVSAHRFFKMVRAPFVTNLMIAGVVLCASSVLFLGFGGGALETLGRNSTLTGRTDIWNVVLGVPINPVLGTGFESFWLGQRLAYVWSFPIVQGITEAHDGYLEMYLNLGWIGEALLLTVLCAGYRNIQRSLKQEPLGGRLQLGYFMIAVIYNFTEAGFRSTDLVWISFLLATAFVPRITQTASSATKIGSQSLALAET
jgi:exopolysaccharide production protein ExoQ